MTIFIDLEVLLIKLLSRKNDGVRYKDIKEYAHIIYDISDKYDVKIMISGISKNELERVVDDYPALFRIFNDTYYGKFDNANYFDRRNCSLVNKILDEALDEYEKKLDELKKESNLGLVRKKIIEKKTRNF